MSASKLADVAELIMGQSPPSSTYNENGRGLPFYQGKTDFGNTFPTPRVYCSAPQRTAEPGDILISVRAPVGATNLCNSKCSIGRGIAAIRPTTVDGEFLYFNLKKLESYIDSLGSGAIFKAINKAQLASIPVNEPNFSIHEQKAIAHVLSTVQRGIEAQERIIQTTTELKKALMHKLFTEGTCGEKQKQTEIGLVPESWEVTTVQRCVDKGIIAPPVDGNHGEIHPKSSDFVESGIPFVMASDIKNGQLDLKQCAFLSRTQATKLRKGFSVAGDVLLTHKATIGETAIVPEVPDFIMLTPQVTYYRVLRKDALLNTYLRYFFESSNFQAPLRSIAGDGSTRAYIGITKQRALPLLIPQFDQQVELAAAFKVVDHKIAVAYAKKKSLNDLFRTLLRGLLSAEIPVAKGSKVLI